MLRLPVLATRTSPGSLGLVGALLPLPEVRAIGCAFRVPGVGMSGGDLARQGARVRATPKGQVTAAGGEAPEGGQLPGRREAARGERRRSDEAVEAYLEGRSSGPRPRPSRSWASSSGPPSSTSRPATTRRRRRSSRRPGKPAKAAALFLEKGNNLEAARLFGLAEQWDKAADLYAKSGYPLRAAEAYEKKGEFVKAARGLREALHGERLVRHDLLVDRRRPPTRRARSCAGRLYEKAGDLQRALPDLH